jgi:small subunit ribosomal protein S8e
MPQWHGDMDKTKITGGKKHRYRTKRAFEMGNDPTETRLGNAARKISGSRGNVRKMKILSEKYANITNTSTHKTQKVEILRVIKNPANVDYDRRKIITKGTITGTQLGEALITSRPGQNGVINAIIIGEKTKS